MKWFGICWFCGLIILLIVGIVLGLIGMFQNIKLFSELCTYFYIAGSFGIVGIGAGVSIIEGVKDE